MFIAVMYEQSFVLGGRSFRFDFRLLSCGSGNHDLAGLNKYLMITGQFYPVLFSSNPDGSITLSIHGSDEHIFYDCGKYYFRYKEFSAFTLVHAVNRYIKSRISFLPVNKLTFRTCANNSILDSVIFSLSRNANEYYFTDADSLLAFCRERFGLSFDDIESRFGFRMGCLGNMDRQLSFIMRMMFSKTKPSFKDDRLLLNGNFYEIKLSRFGGYYLSGGSLYDDLDITRSEFVSTANTVLGCSERYPGVCPEFKSKDDLVRVINFIIDRYE